MCVVRVVRIFGSLEVFKEATPILRRDQCRGSWDSKRLF